MRRRLGRLIFVRLFFLRLLAFGRSFRRYLGCLLRQCLKTSPQREMQIHALAQLFALHAEQREARGIDA